MTNAKKKKSLLYVALCLALSVMLLVGVLMMHTSAADTEADSGTPYVTILAKNVEYSDTLHIMFALDTNYPENAGVEFWSSEDAIGSADLGYVKEIYGYVDDESLVGTAVYGKPYVRTEGIAAKDIVKDIYARAYVTVDGETYYSDVIRYSVLEYMHERLFDLSCIPDVNKTAKQKNQVILYNRTLEYGAAAQSLFGVGDDRFAGDEFVFVEVEGGKLGDGYTSGLFTPGESVTVSTTNTTGFVGWKVNGAIVSTDTTYTFDADNSIRISASYAVPVATVNVTNGTGGGTYELGETVTVTADNKSASKQTFKGWTLDGEIVSASSTYSFTVTEDLLGKTLELVSEYYEPVTVTVSNGSGAGTYAVGESYTVTANDRTASKYVFKAWSGASTSTKDSFTVNVTADMAGKSYAYTANYYAPAVVTVNYGTGAGTYAVGETYTVTAADRSATKHVFKAWSGSSTSTSSTFTATVTEAMAGGSYSYTATYYEPVTVTVTDGAGSGKYAVGDRFTVSANNNGYPVVGIYKNGALVTSNDSLTVEVTAAMAGTTLQYAVKYITETKVYVNGDYVGTYTYGEQYTVTAPEVDGKLFKQWSDGTKSLSITATADGTDKYYVAEYHTLNTATFDGAAEGAFVSGSYGGVKITGSTTNENGGYEIAYDPEDSTNKVLYIYEKNPDSGSNGDFNIYVDSSTTGTVTVIEFDMYIESSSNGAALQFFFGRSFGGVYAQRLDYTSGSYRYYEYYQNDSNATDIDVMFRRNKWINVRYEYYPIYDGSKVVDFKMVQYVDDKPVLVSSTPYNALNQATFDVLHIWQLSGAYGDFYFDNIRAYRTDSPEMTVPTELDKSEVSGDVVKNEAYLYDWEHAYDQVNELYGKDVATAIQGMTDRLFGTDTYTWLAGLYDPKTGGMYYSNSARDNFGYLPDIESTAQGFGLMGSLGVADAGIILTPEQKARIGAWMQMMQSNRDGYFYHPQWGTNISSSRRSRDLTQNGQGLLNSYGKEWFFDHPEYRLGNTGAKQGVANELTYSLSASSAYLVSRVVLASSDSVDESLPKHLLTLDAYKQYLKDQWKLKTSLSTEENLDTQNKSNIIYYNNCYGFGNTITAQGAQIIARDKKAGGDGEYDKGEDGFVEATIDFLNERQAEAQAERAKLGFDPNGLWEVDVVVKGSTVTDYESTYYTISGLLKIIGIYNKMGARLPYAKEAAYSAIKMIMGDAAAYKAAGEAIVSVYNPVNATNGVLNNIRNYGDAATRDATVAEIRKYMADNALQIVEATEAKIALYRCEDGSYGYNISGSSASSQGAPAAVPGTKEGDVNGTALAVGARSAMLSCLGLSSIPLLPKYDGCTTYDFGDGNGAVPTTHLDIFKHLLAEQDQAIKNTVGRFDGSYDFEDGNLPEGDYTLVENAGDNYILVDTATDLDFNMDFNLSSTEFYYEFSTDMSFDSVSAGTPVEIVVGNESVIVLQLKVSGGRLSFAARSTVASDAGTGSFSINPYTEFNLNLKIYAYKQTEGGTSYYAKLTVTQNGTEYVQYFNSFYNVVGFAIAVSNATVSNLTGASMTLDNVNFIKHGNAKGEYGDYHFDEYNCHPTGVTGGNMVVGIDNMLDTNGETVTMKAGNYYKAPFNFIETQFTMINNTYKVGDSGRAEMLDKDGKVIMALGYVLGNNTYTVDLLGAFSAGKPTKGQTLLTVPADISKEITVRAEFHYDRTIGGVSTPTLDVIVKYIDAETGLMDAKATTVSGVLVSETGAAAAEFTTLAFTSTSESVYLNDVYTRRVLTIEQSADSSGDNVTGEVLGKYDFTNGDPLGGVTGGGSGISYDVGVMIVGPKAGNFKIVQSDYNADTVYTTGDKFVMKMDFTFVSGKAGAEDYKPAWAGFLTDGDYLHNSSIHQSQMTYDVTEAGAEANALKWLGYTFKKGVTYSIEVTYTVGGGSELYVNGNLVSSAPVKTATKDAGNFYGFGIEMRTAGRGNNDFVFVLDNVDLYVVEAN